MGRRLWFWFETFVVVGIFRFVSFRFVFSLALAASMRALQNATSFNASTSGRQSKDSVFFLRRRSLTHRELGCRMMIDNQGESSSDGGKRKREKRRRDVKRQSSLQKSGVLWNRTRHASVLRKTCESFVCKLRARFHRIIRAARKRGKGRSGEGGYWEGASVRDAPAGHSLETRGWRRVQPSAQDAESLERVPAETESCWRHGGDGGRVVGHGRGRRAREIQLRRVSRAAENGGAERTESAGRDELPRCGW